MDDQTQKPMSHSCPQCGAPLPPGKLEGLCPGCLLRQAVSPETVSPEVQAFQPLTVEEVAKLFPNLEIISMIGRGGMGAVYKARQPNLDRFVALKLLLGHRSADPAFVERFNREARALAKLNHPNIVAVHEFGHAKGIPFLMMEYVDGLNLRQLEKSRQIKPTQALEIIPRICEALQFAHEEGVVHRDIKPENILINTKGRVKIADFGIAKITGMTGPGPTGEAEKSLGTPHYMAPEQLENPSAVDHRADIFSLGVVFYEMLTGELPLGKFGAPSEKVPMDSRLDDVVLRAMEEKPERRYQQAEQMRTAVTTIASTQSAPPSRPEQRKLSRGVLIAAWVGVALLLVIALVLITPLLTYRFLRVSAPVQPRSEGVATAEKSVLESTSWAPIQVPGQRVDLTSIRTEIQTLTQKQKYAEALERCIWYHAHALEHGEMNPVRLSFGLSLWAELARRYAPAKQALVARRDECVKDLLESRGFFDLFLELTNINQYLGEERATLATFREIERRDPALAKQCYHAIVSLFIKEREYDLTAKYMGDPRASFRSMSEARDMERKQLATMPGHVRDRLQSLGDKRFRDSLGQLVELLVATGREAEATNICEQAVMSSNDSSLTNLLAEARARAQR